MYNTDMNNTDMYNIKSKNMLLKIKSIQIYCFQKKISASCSSFLVRYNRICKSFNFPELRVHYAMYKHTDTWIV